MKTWLLLLMFANGAPSVLIEVPSEQACKSAAGVVLGASRRQSGPYITWACIPPREEDT
jgi:hypothetical protein